MYDPIRDVIDWQLRSSFGSIVSEAVWGKSPDRRNFVEEKFIEAIDGKHFGDESIEEECKIQDLRYIHMRKYLKPKLGEIEILDRLLKSDNGNSKEIHLTKMERSICNALGLGLSRKDVREIVGISTVSLRVALHKIQKKVNAFAYK